MTTKDSFLKHSKKLKTNNREVRFFPYRLVGETGQFIC